MDAQGQLAQALVFEILPHGVRLSPGTPEQPSRTSARDPAAAPSGFSGGSPRSPPAAPLLRSIPRNDGGGFSDALAWIAESEVDEDNLAAASTAPVVKDGLLLPSSSDDLLRGLSVLSQIPIMATLIDEELGPVFQNELSRR